MSTIQETYSAEDRLDWWLERYLLESDAGAVPIVEEDTEDLWLISD
jgi:hypothetical protein